MAIGAVTPQGTKGIPPKSMVIEPSIEYGKYIAKYVANCYGCHTDRDLKTGAFIGEPFAGGLHFAPDRFSEGKAFNSPNLTPDPKTGIMSEWTEETFIARFREGRLVEGSPMPWGAFSRIDEVELKALYLYFNSIKPVENEVNNVVIVPET
jgi:hypothetical protein